MSIRRRHVALVVAAMCALSSDVASAQTTDRLRVVSGSRLRVLSTIDANAITGTLTEIRSRRGRAPQGGFEFPEATVNGLIIGGGGGFVGGAIVGNLTGRERWETVFVGRSSSPADR